MCKGCQEGKLGAGPADKEVLEKVQQRAVMMVSNLRGTYEERLVVLNMRTLEDRRTRGDLFVYTMLEWSL